MRAHGFMAINKIKKNRGIYRFNMYEKIKTSLFFKSPNTNKTLSFNIHLRPQ